LAPDLRNNNEVFVRQHPGASKVCATNDYKVSIRRQELTVHLAGAGRPELQHRLPRLGC
jgi:hypothetical protein